MIKSELQVINVVASVPPVSPTSTDNPASQYANFLHQLLKLQGVGYDWMRTFEIPGRKMLRKIVGDAYSVFVSIERTSNRVTVYGRLAQRLRNDKVRLHIDAPNSAIVVRTVFPTLDPSRVSKYARALDAAMQRSIQPDAFVAFVDEAGGFEKIRLAPVAVLVPAQPAKVATPETFKLVSPPVDDAELSPDDLNDDELEALEYGDELYELISRLKQSRGLVMGQLTPDQQTLLSQGQSGRFMLICDATDGAITVIDQVPYVEDALIKAYRQRYPTCDDLRQASPGNASA